MAAHRFSAMLVVIVAMLCLGFLAGCDLLEGAVSDVDGWDLSACVNGFGTCWELMWDNQDRLAGLMDISQPGQ